MGKKRKNFKVKMKGRKKEKGREKGIGQSENAVEFMGIN